MLSLRSRRCAPGRKAPLGPATYSAITFAFPAEMFAEEIVVDELRAPFANEGEARRRLTLMAGG